MIFQFDGRHFLAKFSPRYSKLSQCVKTIVLPDGRIAQMQITITTNEEDFCTQIDQMNAVVNTLSKSDEI